MAGGHFSATNQTNIGYGMHVPNTVLAYVFGKRKDSVFQELKTCLFPSISVVITPIIGRI
jgi:IS1 family transposase